MKLVNYVEYKHSYAHALEPKLKTLNYYANVLKKPTNYIKAMVRNTMNQGSVVWTDKEQFFFETLMAQNTAYEVYKYCSNACKKAKTVIVKVDDEGELISF